MEASREKPTAAMVEITFSFSVSVCSVMVCKEPQYSDLSQKDVGLQIQNRNREESK